MSADECNEEETALSENPVVTFKPPVYIQRYNSVKDILNDDQWRSSISKVIDFGCNDFKFLRYIKDLKHIEHIIGVDIDEEAIKKAQFEARPLPYLYVFNHTHKLTVELYLGSIIEPDKRLLNADAVICIELIEHLYPEVLEKVPVTIFKCIRPKLAIFTTPNADFNVLFQLKGFRHDDHKFEWTRKEFEDWCFSITEKYNYDVEFQGVGPGPFGTEHLGGCSQMAIFTQKSTEEFSDNNSELVEEPYKLYDKFEYPYTEDERTDEEKFLDDLKYRINRACMNKAFENEDEINEIPIDYLWGFLTNWCPTVDDLVFRLHTEGYEIKKNLNNEDFIEVTLDSLQSEESSEENEFSCGSLNLNDVTYDIKEEEWV